MKKSKIKKAPHRKNEKVSALLKALLILLGMVLGLSALGAVMIEKSVLQEDTAGVLAHVILLLAAMTVPIPILRKTEKGFLPAAFAVDGIMLLILLLGKVAACREFPYSGWTLIPTAFAGAAAAAFLQLRHFRRK